MHLISYYFMNYPPSTTNTEQKDLSNHVISIAYAIQNYLQSSQGKKEEEPKEEEHKKRSSPDDKKYQKNAIVKYKPDWICPNKNCSNRNFAKRKKCNRCGEDRPQNPELDYTYTSGYSKKHKEEGHLPVVAPEKKASSPGENIQMVVSRFEEWFKSLSYETQLAISNKVQSIMGQYKGVKPTTQAFNPFECAPNPFLQR